MANNLYPHEVIDFELVSTYCLMLGPILQNFLHPRMPYATETRGASI